jgi:hypothetical protein
MICDYLLDNMLCLRPESYFFAAPSARPVSSNRKDILYMLAMEEYYEIRGRQEMDTLNFKPEQMSPVGEEKRPVLQGSDVHDKDCRCKEAANMSARELLRLMMEDLSIWKKSKRR